MTPDHELDEGEAEIGEQKSENMAERPACKHGRFRLAWVLWVDSDGKNLEDSR